MGQMTRRQAAGGDFDAYLAPAQPAPGPGILLLHAWWGLNETMRDLADRLAADSFTVLAPDLFDGTVLRTVEEADKHVGEVEANADRLFARVNAGLDHLLADTSVVGHRAAVIGFSFGAYYGTRLAEERPEAAVLVTYYGGMGTELPGDPDKGTHPAFLGHFAADDPYEDHTAEVPGFSKRLAAEEGGSAAHLYEGTHHWFAEADRPEYNEAASELAYRRTVEFIHANLG